MTVRLMLCVAQKKNMKHESESELDYSSDEENNNV